MAPGRPDSGSGHALEIDVGHDALIDQLADFLHIAVANRLVGLDGVQGLGAHALDERIGGFLGGMCQAQTCHAQHDPKEEETARGLKECVAHEADCKNRMIRTVYIEGYEFNNLQGKKLAGAFLEEGDPTQAFEKVKKNSIEDVELGFACK